MVLLDKVQEVPDVRGPNWPEQRHKAKNVFGRMDYIFLLSEIRYLTQPGTEAEPLPVAILLEEALEEFQVTARVMHSSVLGCSFF